MPQTVLPSQSAHRSSHAQIPRRRAQSRRHRVGELAAGSVAKHVAVDQEAPHGHWKTITLVVGLRHDGMVAPFVIDGPMSGTIFLAYVEQCLAPTLDRCDVVIMDNLPAHKVAGVTDAIEA
ncbi:MAG: hypothetical protein E6G77_20055, partial [Alphaproteobacteria bacterium]